MGRNPQKCGFRGVRIIGRSAIIGSKIAAFYPVTNRIEIDCFVKDWQPVLEAYIREGGDANLTNFDFNLHGEFCLRLANEYGLEFGVSRAAGEKMARLRKSISQAARLPQADGGNSLIGETEIFSGWVEG